MRHKIVKAIREEVAHAKVGRKAAIVFKLNNLTDAPTIKHLIKAGQEGVRVRLMVRGMFTLVPGVPGLTDHIEAAGIVDRYLEHTRVFWFHNDGDNRMWITSSDLMPRNLDGRVEVACPIYDASIQAELMEYLDLQWRDNVKTRILDDGFTNKRRPSDPPLIRAQEEIYRSLKKRSGGERKIEKTKPAETSPIFIHPAL
jgi:polyphosphate kinase